MKIELNMEQKECTEILQKFLNEPNKDNQLGLFVIKGAAGTGKTTVVGMVLEDYLAFDIVVLAPTNKAKMVIANKSPAGIKAMTLHSVLGLIPNYNSSELRFSQTGDCKLPNFDIIIVDEASMIFDGILDLFLSNINSSQKVIFMGDSAQLPPVGQDEDSKVFDLLKVFELTQIMRQDKDSPIQNHSKLCRNIIKDINDGKHVPIDTKYCKYNSLESLVFTNSKEKFIVEAIEDFRLQMGSDNKNYVRIIAYRNETNRKINNFVRNKLFDNPTEPFTIGDNLILNQPANSNSTEIIFDTSDEVVVLKVVKDKFTKSLPITFQTVTNIHTKVVKIDIPIYNITITKTNSKGVLLTTILSCVAPKDQMLYKKQLRYLARIITKSGKMHYFKDYYYVIKNQIHAPSYGYAITTHKSQGSTYNIVYVVEDDINTIRPAKAKSLWQSKYVAFTRPSNKLVIYNRS